ncbi:hypothetical protein P3X46_033373 [Hevea brasiliensis]|uniref:BHLH domain-containing protein n=1 Tax=Hevea brasiliensis TaxID=3981 RepID=A0ABQ9KI41_HEVBR|nr:hypothetical protein P3X46_033373 [Hevea brasiliensis]
MEFAGSTISELCNTQESSGRGRLGWRRIDYDDTREYKSKNLHAERRRRQKLSDRLLALRSLVPIITNMNKATVIEDAITYIQKLQQNAKLLSDQLLEMQSSSEEAIVKTMSDEINAAKEMKQFGIMLWIKIILEKKRWKFTRLIEPMTYIGLELSDTNGSCGDTLTVDHTKELLLETIGSIWKEERSD